MTRREIVVVETPPARGQVVEPERLTGVGDDVGDQLGRPAAVRVVLLGREGDALRLQYPRRVPGWPVKGREGQDPLIVQLGAARP